MATRELPLEQRNRLRDWMQAQLVYAGYLSGSLDSSDFLYTLAARAGIPYDDMRSCAYDGGQLELTAIRSLADALGMHPVSIAYISSHISEDAYQRLIVNGSRMPTSQELRYQLMEADEIPEGLEHLSESIRNEAIWLLPIVENLEKTLGLTGDDFSHVTNNIIRLEININHSAYEYMGYETHEMDKEVKLTREPGPTHHRSPNDLPDNEYL